MFFGAKTGHRLRATSQGTRAPYALQLPSLANSATSRFVSHGRQFRLNDCVHCCTHASGPAQVIQKPREQVKRQAGGLAPHLDELGVVPDG